MAEIRYLRQEVDYLGFLESQLRGLSGFETLVYEMIQNADDVLDEQGEPASSRITFDLRDDALMVKNDGVFLPKDFDSMQHIARGDKRLALGTTGAFGVGFISVYQVTDAPEIFSSGRHWTIRPDLKAAYRIEERSADTEGTVFRLPWATDPTSKVRRGLRVAPFDATQLDSTLEIVCSATRLAALFLKQLSILEVRRNGELVQRVMREFDRQEGILWGRVGEELRAWTFLRGEFEDDATDLRRRYPDLIEPKRHSNVTVAIQDRLCEDPRLFAVLPTEVRIPVPCHINADFYPTPDRKSIIFREDYQSAWNRAAIRAAARAVNGNLDRLRSLLGHVELWRLIESIEACHAAPPSHKPDEVFDEFWREIGPTLSDRAIVYTMSESWVQPQDAKLLQTEAERDAADILQQLGIPIVDLSLRPFTNLLRRREVGVSLICARDVVLALEKAGATNGLPLSRLPSFLSTKESWQRLWRVFDALLQKNRLRDNSTNQDRERRRLSKTPLALDTDGCLYPPEDLCDADEDTRALFPMVRWLAMDCRKEPLMHRLVPRFDIEEALAALSSLGEEGLQERYQAGALNLHGLYAWFAARVDRILEVRSFSRELMKLPLWPSSGKLCALKDLYLPADFQDPLGLSNVIDVKAIEGYVDFVRRLGAKSLDFRTYVTESMPQWLKEHPDSPQSLRRQIVRMLAARLGEIRDDDAILETLRELPIIECRDGTFTEGPKAYLDSESTRLLGESASIVNGWYKASEAVVELYTWLGVADEPRPRDLVRRVSDLVASPPTHETIQTVRGIFTHLASRFQHARESPLTAYEKLRSLAWLPGTKHQRRWFRPSDVYTVFQEYLFASQGEFLALPAAIQKDAARGSPSLIGFLGIPSVPEPMLVVRHLLRCVKDKTAVHREVYTFLQQHLDDPAVDILKGRACLPLGEGQYLEPRRAFWREHPFGPYRYQLGTEWFAFRDLFDRLGVREQPGPSDYRDVLLEACKSPEGFARALDKQTQEIVLSCWEGLQIALETEQIPELAVATLENEKVIPDAGGFPMEPRRLFFEDRPGLAERFAQALGNNLIRRSMGSWRAMATAGVRPLSEVVNVRLVEARDDAPDALLGKRLQERRSAIARVLESLSDGQSTESRLGALAELSCRKASKLTVRYSANPFGRPIATDPEEVTVLVLDNTLFTTYQNHTVPWAAVAREIGFLLKPEGNVGALAGGIKEALSYDTAEEAQRALGELGYPPLAERESSELPSSQPLDVMGGIETADADSTADEGTLSRTETGDVDRELQGGMESPGVHVEALETGTPEASGTGDSAAEKGDTAQSTGISDGATGDAGGGTKKAQAVRRRTRLLSYIVLGKHGEEGTDVKAPEHMRKVERSGIQYVLEQEKAQGRNPHEMDRLNEGYDVRSTDPDGEERFIEVKALSGEWSARNPAQLTSAEYDMGKAKGSAYWLYVVELATTQPRLYMIHDPTNRVDRYCLDYGWKAVAQQAG